MRYNRAILYLSEDAFEEMVNAICQNILGLGVISFAKGLDGGKDGRFTGKANNFPSKSEPWNGKIIIQAKHTENPIAKCTDGNFFSNKESIINKESIRVKKLKEEEGLDFYLLFTNRKYSGGGDCKIRKALSAEIGLPISNIEIIGTETLNSYLNRKESTNIIKQFQLNKYYLPFDFSEEEIKQIIIAFKKQLADIEAEILSKSDEIKYDYERILIEEKNEKNRLSSEYFENEIKDKSIQEFTKIENFLGDPRNSDLKDMYYDIASELSQLITMKRTDFGGFEEIFLFIYDKMCSGNNSFLGKKIHVTTFLHFMYFSCDIGKK